MISVLWIFFDALLAGMLIGLSWAAVATRHLQRAVVLFISLGLLMALVWSRLQAPDLALAEAAIGAGVAGALLLAAVRDEKPVGAWPRGPQGLSLIAINIGSLGLFVLVTWGLLHALIVSDGIRLGDVTAASMSAAGVIHPVTAVLLNFRAYDTLLELAVVFAAVLGILALGPARANFQRAQAVLFNLVRWLVPLLIITAGFLLWVGAHAPGGAFQAGATLAAAGILLRLIGFDSGGLPGNVATRWLLVLGVGLFMLVGLVVMPGQQHFLQYPGELAGQLILLIESAATLSIAAALTLAYIGGRPAGWESPPETASNDSTASKAGVRPSKAER